MKTNYLRLSLCWLLAASVLPGQTKFNQSQQTVVTVGTSLPSVCTAGQLFFNTSVTAGSNLYGCTATNTWTLLGGSNGNAQSAASVSPASLTFAAANPGVTSAAQTIVLSDPGLSYLSISGITITGTNASDFSQTNNCGSQVGSGNSCTISVTFTPTAPSGGAITWTEAATLNIAGNQPGSPATVTLSGSGVLMNGGLVVTSSSTSAKSGQTVTLTSNRAVTFTQSGTAGTLSQTDSTHATYTAPSTIPVQTPVQGCPLYPNDAVLNTPINALPVNANSTAWTSQIQNYGISAQPTYWQNALTSAPSQTIVRKFYYAETGGTYPFLIYPNRLREGGSFASNGDGQDHHTFSILVAPGSTQCTAYETYNDSLASNYTYACQNGTSGCNAQSGDIISPNSYAINASTDAAGLPQYLTLHVDEIKNNLINHPIRFTLAAGWIQNNSYPSLWPANSGNNGYGSNSNTLPYGARLRLKSSYSVSGKSTYAQNILNALKNQGIMLADIGTTGALITDGDIHEDPIVEAAVSEALTGLSFANFEVVDESSLMLATNSMQVNPANGYVTPTSSAVLLATDAAPVQGHTYSASFGVALVGVGIGLKNAQVAMVPGSYTYNFAGDAWVTGQTSQTTTWALVSGPGSVTSAGVYTPPSTVSSVTAVVLSASAGGTTVKQYINLYPLASDGAFRIAEAPISSAGVTDTNGFVWQPSPGLDAALMQRPGGDYPNWAASSSLPDAVVYAQSAYNYGDDWVHRLILPNGNYKVRVMMVYPNNGCGTPCTQAGAVYTYIPPPLMIGMQSQMVAQDWLAGAAVSYAYQMPWDFLGPAQVTNNQFYFQIGKHVPDGGSSSGLKTIVIGGIEIIPDSTAAHITIGDGLEAFSAGTTTSIAPTLTVAHGGSTAQLYAVGWYMANTATWAVTSGGGTINSAGLYTSGSSTGSVTVTATSTVDSTKTATLNFTVN